MQLSVPKSTSGGASCWVTQGIFHCFGWITLMPTIWVKTSFLITLLNSWLSSILVLASDFYFFWTLGPLFIWSGLVSSACNVFYHDIEVGHKLFISFWPALFISSDFFWLLPSLSRFVFSTLLWLIFLPSGSRWLTPYNIIIKNFSWLSQKISSCSIHLTFSLSILKLKSNINFLNYYFIV